MRTHNLKNIDISIPKDKIITITWVSGSWKSSLAFDTIYKEWQFRYIESLSSYLRQFFNLWSRPDLDSSEGLSPAIAIEQNKRIWNIRSTVWTLAEIDDYLRLMMAKLWDIYCYNCGTQIKAKNVEQIIDDMKEKYMWKKIYILEDLWFFPDQKELLKFIKKNRKKVDSWWWFIRYLIELWISDYNWDIDTDTCDKHQENHKSWSTDKSNHVNNQRIEYFYLEDPTIPDKYDYFKIYGIYDRVTMQESNIKRLKEDIIKILAQTNKFWVYELFDSERVDNDNIDWKKQWTKNVKIENMNIGNIEIGKKQKWKTKSKSVVNDLKISKLDSVVIHNNWSNNTQLLNDDLIYDLVDHPTNPELLRYTDKNFCPNCNINYPEFTTQHFSPNRAEWACEHCHGIWQSLQVDFDRLIDPQSEYMKAILPWRDSSMWQAILEKLASKFWINLDLKWKDIPDWFKDVVIKWDWELIRISMWWKYVSMYYKWVEDLLTQQYHKWILTVDFQSMLEIKDCPSCKWSKLRPESLSVYISVNRQFENTYENSSWQNILSSKKKNSLKWSNKSSKKWVNNIEIATNFNSQKIYDKQIKFNIHDLQNLTIWEFIEIMELFRKMTEKPHELVDRILNPLLNRANTINSLWLNYLTLTRPIDSLSWWEIQRLRLAKQLWNKLTWIIYVLDEPTIWLDDKEINNTIMAIKNLKDMWNTIIVVEHNFDFIRNSDWIVEVWPWAWDFWWEILYNWTYLDFLKTDTLTAKYITGKIKQTVKFDHIPSNKRISIKKAHKYNLKNIDIDIQLGSFTIITGPSGAGKTTLMFHTLFSFLNDKQKFVQSYIRLQMLKKWMSWSEIISSPIMKPEEFEHMENLALQEFYKEICVETIKWHENLKNVLYVDQTSIWKTPRSCPATFIGVFDNIRSLFAWVEEARMYGFSPWHFSFNSAKWSCSECEWYGYKKVELQFLPDTYVPCTLCHGKRYKPEILSIKWRGKNISEVLSMYIYEALDYFDDIPFVQEELELMVDIGLGYLKLWQPAHTLSGWESQRLKLVKHLLKSYKWHTMYFLDEPTVWLHASDIEKLLEVLKRFLDKWDTILMIEHEKSLLKYADFVIKLENGKLIV